MKNFKVFTAIAAFVLAVGTMLGNQDETRENSGELQKEENTAILAFKRAIPNDPTSCEVYMEVECSTEVTDVLCTWEISGVDTHLYDSNCQPLFRPI